MALNGLSMLLAACQQQDLTSRKRKTPASNSHAAKKNDGPLWCRDSPDDRESPDDDLEFCNVAHVSFHELFDLRQAPRGRPDQEAFFQYHPNTKTGEVDAVALAYGVLVDDLLANVLRIPGLRLHEADYGQTEKERRAIPHWAVRAYSADNTQIAFAQSQWDLNDQKQIQFLEIGRSFGRLFDAGARKLELPPSLEAAVAALLEHGATVRAVDGRDCLVFSLYASASKKKNKNASWIKVSVWSNWRKAAQRGGTQQDGDGVCWDIGLPSDIKLTKERVLLASPHLAAYLNSPYCSSPVSESRKTALAPATQPKKKRRKSVQFVVEFLQLGVYTATAEAKRFVLGRGYGTCPEGDYPQGVRGPNRQRIVEFLRDNPDPFACRGIVRSALQQGDPRGEFGLFAPRALPRGYVVGAYKGVMWESDEFDAQLELKTVSVRNRALDYAFDLFEGLTIAAHDEHEADANMLRFVNDYRPNGAPNAEFFEFWSADEGSVPMLVLITTKPIAAGGELLVDYTEAYWERHREESHRAESRVESRAVSKEEAFIDSLLEQQLWGGLDINR